METVGTSPLRMLKIEEELAGPDAAEALKRYDERLVALDNRLRQAMSTGLPPEEFTKAEALRNATTLARKVMRIAVGRN